MPIPKKEFMSRSNLDEDHQAVYNILLKEKENALSEQDIIKQLNDYIIGKVDRPLASFELQKLLEEFKLRRKLESLLKLGLIKSGINKNIEYFYVENE